MEGPAPAPGGTPGGGAAKGPGCPLRPGRRSELSGQGSALSGQGSAVSGEDRSCPVRARHCPVRARRCPVRARRCPVRARRCPGTVRYRPPRGQRRSGKVRHCPRATGGAPAGPPGGAGVAPVPPGAANPPRGRGLQGELPVPVPLGAWPQPEGAWPRRWRGLSRGAIGGVAWRGERRRGGASHWRAARAVHAGSCSSPPRGARRRQRPRARGTLGVVVRPHTRCRERERAPGAEPAAVRGWRGWSCCRTRGSGPTGAGRTSCARCGPGSGCWRGPTARPTWSRATPRCWRPSTARTRFGGPGPRPPRTGRCSAAAAARRPSRGGGSGGADPPRAGATAGPASGRCCSGASWRGPCSASSTPAPRSTCTSRCCRRTGASWGPA